MFNVYLPGTVLKPSMVISGQENDSRASYEEVASKTIACLKDLYRMIPQALHFYLVAKLISRQNHI